MSRYFEIIITGRQLAAGVAAVVLLLAVAFGLGVAVRWFEPAPPPQEFIAAAPLSATAVPAPKAPTALPPMGGAVATPAPAVATPPAQAAAAALLASPSAATPVVPARATVPIPAPARTPVATAPASPVAVAETPAGRWVQATALSRQDQADGVRTRVMALGFTADQVVVQPAPRGKFRVRVGPFPDGESAARVAARLQAQGFKGAFVVKAGE